MPNQPDHLKPGPAQVSGPTDAPAPGSGQGDVRGEGVADRENQQAAQLPLAGPGGKDAADKPGDQAGAEKPVQETTIRSVISSA